MHREPQQGQARKGACRPKMVGISRDGGNDRVTEPQRDSPNAVRNKKHRPRTTEEVRGRREGERNRAVADAACRRVVRREGMERGQRGRVAGVVCEGRRLSASFPPRVPK